MANILVTGGAGFIGANFVHYWRARHPADGIVVLDALTYAGNPANLAGLTAQGEVSFIHGDVCDEELVAKLLAAHQFEKIVHFAAESHVDRSITSPDDFIRTNVQGTHVLLKAALLHWKNRSDSCRFHHVSTDEVYGSLLPEDAPSTESSRYDPRSPYAASKAASDFLVRAYAHTYGLPVTISNCSNNYGPFQFPEKVVPLMILHALTGRPMPVYGDGKNVRDWIHVEDHCALLSAVIDRGMLGETYNIGGNNQTSNNDLVELLCDLVDRRVKSDRAVAERFPDCPAADGGSSRDLIVYVKDRPGHDRRYALDTRKISREFDAPALRPLRDGLSATLEWYLANEPWWRAIQSGEYRNWISQQYGIAV